MALMHQTGLLLLFLLCSTYMETGDCFSPVRVGNLTSKSTIHSISGSVFLLDRQTVYIKDFSFSVEDTVPGLSLRLKDKTYTNNCSVIPISEVGDGVDDSLICVSDSTTCCRGRDNPNGGGQGEWYSPDGTQIPRPADSAGSSLYRTRGRGEIRLNRRGGTSAGKYCCVSPTASGTQKICADLVSSVPSEGDAHFCAGFSPSPTQPVTVSLDHSTVGFESGYSNPHLELRLPATSNITKLSWFGVCSTSAILTRVSVHPSSVCRLSCEAKYLGDLTPGDGEVRGRVYLVNRITFAILCFSYSDEKSENDAVFWAGSGNPGVNGYSLTYGNDITTTLKPMVDQDVLVNIPERVQEHDLSYLSVWSRSKNVNLGHVTFRSDSIPPLPPKVPAAKIGKFLVRLHDLKGTAYAINDKDIVIVGFNYDGTGPAVNFRAVKGPNYLSSTYANLADDNGSYGNLRGYEHETIFLTLPEGYTVSNTDYLSVWCYHFQTSFGEVTFPDSISFEPGTLHLIQPTPPTPEEECPPLNVEKPAVNCKRLHDNLTMSWILDQQQNQATIELCGCGLEDQYIAFGLSGSNSRIQMVGSDTVWAWLDNTGVHAQELNINQYTQCNIRQTTGLVSITTRSGACPETSNNVNVVSGYMEGCTTCIKFNRPITSTDPLDKAITPLTKQWMVWAIGPVGSLQTPSGSFIPVPFKHYLRPSYSDNLSIDFGRAPMDECGNVQCNCRAKKVLYPWIQPRLKHNTTILVQIGLSGGTRGFAGITGIVGWGIAIYLNGLLIPKVTVRRGTTYNFIVETGNDPTNPARYHPFYITSSERGGYDTLSTDNKNNEVIYAGLDKDGNWAGVGRFCHYHGNGRDRSDEFDSFLKFRDTLELRCDDGEPGMFTWTPDENTPDLVYYQCASHQYLGWKITVEDALPSTPEPQEVPLEIDMSEGFPLILGDSITITFDLTKAPTSIACELHNEDTQEIITMKCKNPWKNHYNSNVTELSIGSYTLVITLTAPGNENLVFERKFDIFYNPMSCGVLLTGSGANFDLSESLLSVIFSSTGVFDSFSCVVNGGPPTACDSPYSQSGSLLPEGMNEMCIQVENCKGDETKNLTIKFDTLTGIIIIGDDASPVSLTTTPTTQPSVSMTTSTHYSSSHSTSITPSKTSISEDGILTKTTRDIKPTVHTPRVRENTDSVHQIQSSPTLSTGYYQPQTVAVTSMEGEMVPTVSQGDIRTIVVDSPTLSTAIAGTVTSMEGEIVPTVSQGDIRTMVVDSQTLSTAIAGTVTSMEGEMVPIVSQGDIRTMVVDSQTLSTAIAGTVTSMEGEMVPTVSQGDIRTSIVEATPTGQTGGPDRNDSTISSYSMLALLSSILITLIALVCGH